MRFDRNCLVVGNQSKAICIAIKLAIKFQKAHRIQSLPSVRPTDPHSVQVRTVLDEA